MTETLSEPANTLNNIYIQESGLGSRPFLHKDYAWGVWSAHGFSEDDLRLTCRYLRREVIKGKRKPACLSFRNLIERCDTFDCELELAKHDQLFNKKETKREEILRATGRDTTPAMDVKMPRELVGKLLGQLRASL